MKAKIKSGHNLLFTQGVSNYWNNLKDEMIINFMNRYTFDSFKQVKNHLYLYTSKGIVDIVFTGITPKLEFEYFEKIN